MPHRQLRTLYPGLAALLIAAALFVVPAYAEGYVDPVLGDAPAIYDQPLIPTGVPANTPDNIAWC